jgi:hypothetical protein
MAGRFRAPAIPAFQANLRAGAESIVERPAA